jgi:hypothetical protein
MHSRNHHLSPTPAATLLTLLLLTGIPSPAQVNTDYPGFNPPGTLYRESTKSRIVFDMPNDGSLFGSFRLSGWGMLMWPRETFERVYYAIEYEHGGIWFGCLKEGRKLVSAAAMPTAWWISHANVNLSANQFVPGFIGDPRAATDTAFGGAGWRYVDDPNYILYLSTDYDASGQDVSGNNLPDWPIRLVGGKEVYVHEPLQRHLFPPVFKSDEDFFTIYKDTDTRSDPEFLGAQSTADSASFPIGVEVRQHCYTWSSTLLRNAIVLDYEIHNKSGFTLHDCYVGISNGIDANATSGSGTFFKNLYFSFDGTHKIGQCYDYPVGPNDGNPQGLDARIGYSLLDTPRNANGDPLGITFWKSPVYGPRLWDSNRYEWFVREPMIDSLPQSALGDAKKYKPTNGQVLFGTGPLNMAPGDSIRLVVELSCAIGYDELLRLHNFLKVMYANNFKQPAPPEMPTLSATTTEGSVLLRWDDAAERSIDASVPDTFGKPFAGYRLYRSRGEGSPYVLIREWKTGRDSLVHKYLDRGQDGKDPTILVANGLVQNIPYTYKLTAFDEAVPSLEIPEMENAGSVAQATASATPSSPYALDDVRIVPNPYIVEHAAQKTIDAPKLFFNFLPEVCTIRIYTVALDLVAELHHSGGSAESWDLKAQGGQQVASQMFLAVIETPQGTRVTKKFAVVAAE